MASTDPRDWKEGDEIHIGGGSFKLTGQAIYKQLVSDTENEQFRAAWNATHSTGEGPLHIVLAINMKLWLSIDEWKANQKREEKDKIKEGTITPHKDQRRRQAMLELADATLSAWCSDPRLDINKHDVVDKVYIAMYDTTGFKSSFDSFRNHEVWVDLGKTGVTIPQDQPALRRLQNGLKKLHEAGYQYTGSYEVFVFPKDSDIEEGCFLLEMNEVEELGRRKEPFDNRLALTLCQVPRRISD